MKTSLDIFKRKMATPFRTQLEAKLHLVQASPFVPSQRRKSLLNQCSQHKHKYRLYKPSLSFRPNPETKCGRSLQDQNYVVLKCFRQRVSYRRRNCHCLGNVPRWRWWSWWCWQCVCYVHFHAASHSDKRPRQVHCAASSIGMLGPFHGCEARQYNNIHHCNGPEHAATQKAGSPGVVLVLRRQWNDPRFPLLGYDLHD